VQLIIIFCSLWGNLVKKAQGSIVSNQIGTKFGRNVLHVNTHRLTESDFRYDVTFSKWQPWRYFTQKSAATWWVNSKCMPHKSVHQFLIY